MKSPRLIMFDCDGTLADTQFIAVEAMRLAFRTQNLPYPTRHDILRTYGLCSPEAVQYLAPSIAPDIQNKIAVAYLDWHYTLRQQPEAQEAMYEGAGRLLASLSSQDDVILGIATGKSHRGLQHFLAQNGLEGLFATMQTADHNPSKPHPAMLEKAMSETDVRPENTYMIGDTTADIIMSARAGVYGIGVSWGYQSACELTQAGAPAVVDSFLELSRLLSASAAVLAAPRLAIAAA